MAGKEQGGKAKSKGSQAFDIGSKAFVQPSPSIAAFCRKIESRKLPNAYNLPSRGINEGSHLLGKVLEGRVFQLASGHLRSKRHNLTRQSVFKSPSQSQTAPLGLKQPREYKWDSTTACYLYSLTILTMENHQSGFLCFFTFPISFAEEEEEEEGQGTLMEYHSEYNSSYPQKAISNSFILVVSTLISSLLLLLLGERDEEQKSAKVVDLNVWD